MRPSVMRPRQQHRRPEKGFALVPETFHGPVRFGATEFSEFPHSDWPFSGTMGAGLLGFVSIHVIALSHRGLSCAFDRVALCKALIPVPGIGRNYGFGNPTVETFHWHIS